MVEYLSSRRIERRFRFCYQYRSIDTALVRLIASNMSQQNHYHIIISFYNHHRLYYFVNIFSIKLGWEVVEDFSLRRIEQIFRFFYIWGANVTALVRLLALKTSHIIGWTKKIFIFPVENRGEIKWSKPFIVCAHECVRKLKWGSQILAFWHKFGL